MKSLTMKESQFLQCKYLLRPKSCQLRLEIELSLVAELLLGIEMLVEIGRSLFSFVILGNFRTTINSAEKSMRSTQLIDLAGFTRVQKACGVCS